jgi:transketolase
MAQDSNLFFLTADMGINLVEPIETAFPERFVNVGIAEQDLIGVAAGLCNTGFRPIAYTIGNFLTQRCYEQIRNDVALHEYPVILLGASAGFDNAPLGPTHHLIDDWGSIRNLPGIDVYAPASVEYAASVLDRVLATPRPAYIRVAKGSRSIPGSDDDVVYLPGTARGTLLISYGSLASECVKAQAANADLSVLILNRVHPLDAATIAPYLMAHHRSLVVEDHFGHSGLYASVCQLAMEHRLNCLVESVAPPPRYDLVVGATAASYHRRFGLDAQGVLRRVESQAQPLPTSVRPMTIRDTRDCNLWNLERLATFLAVEPNTLIGYYRELLDDAEFLAAVNQQMQWARAEYGFVKGIFARDRVDSADWFAFERILVYVLVRHLRPAWCLETGVYYGGNTAFLLAALHRNGHGRLISIDLPDATIRRSNGDAGHPRHPLLGDTELYDERLRPGFIVPSRLKARWELVEGDSLVEIPKRSEVFDFYIHDSEHSMEFLRAELAAGLPRLSPSATVVADDIDWSNGFLAFCVEQRLRPVLFTDNGKDNLRVRTGLVKLDHPDNQVAAITGSEAAEVDRPALEVKCIA